MFIAVLPSTPDLERSGIEHREPARPVSVAIASMLITTLSPGMQWTVCGRVYPVFAASSAGSITFSSRGRRGSLATSTMWIREERKPGTIRCERSGPWQAELHRFQPKWCSSSPTFGIASSWMI
jgi:hypothetical protein